MPQKLLIEVESTGVKFEVDFNPEEYTVNKDNNFAVQTIPGLAAPLLQFVNGNLRTLDMELFFDTFDTKDAVKRDVRVVVNKVVQLMDIDSNLHAPPVLKLSWSSLQFRCVLVKASQKFIMFNQDGTPVRARVTVTFNEFVDPVLEVQKANLQSPDFSKVYTVKENETLSKIAGQLYDNPQLWRPIAIANGLANPRAIVAGQVLQIPPLPYIDPDSREVVA